MQGEVEMVSRDYGSPDGCPVLMFHGGAGAYPLSQGLEEVASYFGLRIISVDRPGFGGSRSQPALDQLADFANQFPDWLTKRRIGHFALIGICFGAPFAMSLAHRFPERVTGAFLLGGLPDLSLPGVMEACDDAFYRQREDSCRLSEAELGRRLRQGILDFRDNCQQRDMWDPRYEQSGVLLSHYLNLLDHQLGQDCIPMARECKLLFGDWGFAATDIIPPIHLWHAEGDSEIPIAPVRKMTEQLATARLTVQKQDTHYPSDQTMLQVMDLIASNALRGGWMANPGQ